ncbi:hypothetical protein [Pseudomonas sp. GWSMS-1]|uniref:hypothetical protein n=1 Tax=Pseudomonas sp. GWSMS-1 TaxID=3308997 RepID=UPI003CF50A5A
MQERLEAVTVNLVAHPQHAVPFHVRALENLQGAQLHQVVDAGSGALIERDALERIFQVDPNEQIRCLLVDVKLAACIAVGNVLTVFGQSQDSALAAAASMLRRPLNIS